MTSTRPSLAETLRINADLLMAFTFALAAQAIWPSSPEWWGFGLMSLLLGAGAIVLAVRALRTMAAVHAKAKAVADFKAQGIAPKSSRLADDDELRRAGMLR